MAAPVRTCRKFLLQFAHEHIDFRLPELKAIAGLFGISVRLDEENYDLKNPFLVVDLPSEEHAQQITSRSVLVKSVYELWVQSSNHNDLHRKLRELPTDLTTPFLQPDKTFRIMVDGFNKSISQSERIKKIEALPTDVLDFQGKVRLKNPDHSFHLLEYYIHTEGSQSPDDPEVIYFGRWISDGQRGKIRQYHLQKRHFIAHTSMDAGLSLLMANMAGVKENMMVLDPFVGTGSLLVACSHYGAYVMGTDIDYLLLHAKGKPSRHNQTKRAKDESIRANLRQYNLEHLYLDVLVADASRSAMWREYGIFDAIITDPPYGIREGAKKIGTDSENPNLKNDIMNHSHIPQRVDYQLSDIFKDLLNFSAKFLRLNGRLVFWLPVYVPDYREENIPTHPCFQLVANSEQILTCKISRRLITMEKVKEWQDESSFCEGAQIAVDHYEDATFRDKYFRSNRPRSSSRSRSISPQKQEDEIEDKLKTVSVNDR